MQDPVLGQQLRTELNVALAGSPPALRELLISEVACFVAHLDHEDPAVAGPTARRLLLVLWPHRTPDERWWGTPLGRRLAERYPDDDAIGRREAASMLRTARSRVDRLVEEGVLDGRPREAVSRASVLRRLAVTASSPAAPSGETS